jgi:hypothetical protein
MSYDSTLDTLKHINRVRDLLGHVATCLLYRGMYHDASKLGPTEKPLFDEMTPKLKTLVYGSDDYKASLAALKPALDHHYKYNSHHPEHYPNGIDGMNLLDIIEMYCDWIAAGERTKDGNPYRSLEVSEKRFGMSPQLVNIFKNTIANQALWDQSEMLNVSPPGR